jgi:uncharacterized membrane protein (DUF106 family)
MPDAPVDRDARRLTVPLAALIAAVVLTASVVLGTQRLVASEVDSRLAPVAGEIKELREEMKELRKATDALRLEMARKQGAAQ